MKLNTISRLLYLAACTLLINETAIAAVDSSLSFTTPTGTVSSTDTIEVWGTLSLGSGSDPLTYDPGVDSLSGVPASLIPTEAAVWNGDGYDYIPFDSYDYVSLFTGRSCSGTFTAGCSDGEYHISYNPSGSGSGWFDLDSGYPLSLTAGESRDFLLYEFTPTDGDAAPGDYTFYNMSVGFYVYGFDVDGNSISQSVSLGDTCQSQAPSCAFTRTAVSAVPVPAAVWLFGSGLIGLAGVAKRKKNAV